MSKVKPGKVTIDMKTVGDNVKLKIDTELSAVDTATVLFLALMSWYEIDEENVEGIYDKLAEEIMKVKDNEDGK